MAPPLTLESGGESVTGTVLRHVWSLVGSGSLSSYSTQHRVLLGHCSDHGSRPKASRAPGIKSPPLTEASRSLACLADSSHLCFWSVSLWMLFYYDIFIHTHNFTLFTLICQLYSTPLLPPLSLVHFCWIVPLSAFMCVWMHITLWLILSHALLFFFLFLSGQFFFSVMKVASLYSVYK